MKDNEELRGWIYRVFFAGLVVLAAFNLIEVTQDQKEALDNLVTVLVLSFPVGLAARNTAGPLGKK